MSDVQLYDGFYVVDSEYFLTTDVRKKQPGVSQKHNMQVLRDIFIDEGWTLNAIAGMLGNMMVESTINAWLVEGRHTIDDLDWLLSTNKGIGLTQWTPARKFINWAMENDLDYKSPLAQCQRIIYESENNKQWSLNNLGHHTWEQFINSTESPEILARVFLWAYERPAAPDVDQRQKNARWAYDFLLDAPTPPEPDPPDPPEPDPPEPEKGFSVNLFVISARKNKKRKDRLIIK